MENVIKYVTGFFGGLLSIMMAVVPVAILWFVLTGTTIFGMDVVANLTGLLTVFVESRFVCLVALVILAKCFIDRK